MREFGTVIKQTAAGVLVLLLFLLVWGMGAVRLSALSGNREFYLYSPSSQAEIQSCLTWADCLQKRGESVRFALNGQEGEELARSILESLEGELLFVEEVDGVRSYYGVSPCFAESARVRGVRVNLHIAVGEEYCVVGTPLIFGGY